MGKTSWCSLSKVAVDKAQKTRQFLLTKAQNCLLFAGSTISRGYRPYTVSAPIPFFKTSRSPTKSFIFLILWKAPLKEGRWIKTLRAKFKHPTSVRTANTTSCVATKYSNLLKPDYILLILTRNQLSSVVRERTEAGATVMEQGVNLLTNFPLSSPFFSHYGNMRTSSKTHYFLRESLFLKWFFTGMGRLKGTAHMEAPSNRLLPTEVISDAFSYFVCLSFARRHRKKCARVSHKMARFVLKIAHLAFSMEPTQLLRKVSSYGLLPRLWLLKPQKKKT